LLEESTPSWENDPYISLARAHTAGLMMDETHLDALKSPTYLISSETEASQAKYEALRPFLPAYMQMCSTIHIRIRRQSFHPH